MKTIHQCYFAREVGNPSCTNENTYYVFKSSGTPYVRCSNHLIDAYFMHLWQIITLEEHEIAAVHSE